MEKIPRLSLSNFDRQYSHSHHIALKSIAYKIAKKRSEKKGDRESLYRYKNEHLAYISHELRSPLNGILSALDILQNDELNQTQREIIGLASQSANYLSEVINNQLEFSRLQSSQMTVTIKEVAILDLLDQVMQMICLKAKQKGLALKVIVMPDVPLKIETDSLYLRQILINILSNAVKFTEQGYISVRVRCCNNQLEISIADTGKGISEKIQQKVFDPYVREQTHGCGTGLGLAIAAHLSKIMNGMIQLESTLGHGTCFTLLLPLCGKRQATCRLHGTVLAPLTLHAQLALWGLVPQLGHNADLVTEELVYMPGRLWKIVSAKKGPLSLPYLQHHCDDGGQKSPPWKFKILVVDDMEINRYMMMTMLHQLGNDCFLAASGDEALDLGRQHAFDLVLMDINMPNMNGLETTMLWRSQAQAMRSPDCLIVGLTASTLLYSKSPFAARAGMNRCLTKPISLEQLNVLMRWLSLLHKLPQIEQQCVAEEKVSARLELDKPLLDIFNKETHARVKQALMALYTELKIASEKNDKKIVQENLHAIKGIAGQAGMISVLKHVEQMEASVMQKNEIPAHKIKALQTFFS